MLSAAMVLIDILFNGSNVVRVGQNFVDFRTFAQGIPTDYNSF